jgi:predicted RNA-binding Zn ribbon-like protein
MRKLYAGWLCLDFANTVEPRENTPQHDYLRDYAEVVRWGRHAEVLDEATAERLLREAAGRPEEAGASHAAAIELREATYRTFKAIALGNEPAAGDLERLQQAYAEAMRHARLVPGETDRFNWRWDDGDLNRAWWAMARSAVWLIISGPLARVKQCAGAGGCGFLLYDATKNRARRWCSMDECGGQTKATKQTARRRAARAGGKTGEHD